MYDHGYSALQLEYVPSDAGSIATVEINYSFGCHLSSDILIARAGCMQHITMLTRILDDLRRKCFPASVAICEIMIALGVT